MIVENIKGLEKIREIKESVSLGQAARFSAKYLKN